MFARITPNLIRAIKSCIQDRPIHDCNQQWECCYRGVEEIVQSLERTGKFAEQERRPGDAVGEGA